MNSRKEWVQNAKRLYFMTSMSSFGEGTRRDRKTRAAASEAGKDHAGLFSAWKGTDHGVKGGVSTKN